MGEGLKACPFCGGEPSRSCGTKNGGEAWEYIECIDCAGMADSESDWHRRPIEDALRAEAEALEEENNNLIEEHAALHAEINVHHPAVCAEYEAKIAALTAELERWRAPLTVDQIGSVCAIADIDWTSRVDSLDTVIRAVREAGGTP